MADSNWDTIVIWMNEHADRLVRTVTAVTGDSEEAQDIVQETFIRAYRALGTFRGTCNPYTFLYAIAINLVRSKKRMHAKKPQTTTYEDTIASEYGNPEASAIDNEKSRLILEAIESLPEKLKIVTVLFYLSGLSVEDISQVLNVYSATVKTRLFRARERIRQYLAEEAGYGAD